MKHNLRTELEISATPAEVWEVLIDLPSYGSWNPFITSASGIPTVGQRLKVRLEPPNGRAVTLRPTVTEYEPHRVFEWLGRLGFAGIFDGRHRFELTATDRGTKLVQRESFSGVLVRPMRRTLDGSTHAGFLAMNRALARRVADLRHVA